MADINYGNVLSQLGAGALGLSANQQMAQQMATAYNQAGNYVNAAQQQSTGYQSPYLVAGANALPGLQTAVGNVGNQLSMANYQAGPYSQVAASAQKTAADQLKAQAATTGMYGSGNMANALQQNALTTQLQYYDTANQRQLANQQAKASAYYNLANMGATAGQSMGSNTMDAAKYMAAIAQQHGIGQTQTTGQRAALMGSMLNTGLNAVGSSGLSAIGSSLTGLAKSAWNKLSSNETPSEEELDSYRTSLGNMGYNQDQIDQLTNADSYSLLSGNTTNTDWWDNNTSGAFLGGTGWYGDTLDTGNSDYWGNNDVSFLNDAGYNDINYGDISLGDSGSTDYGFSY